jgi:hypothetical protein
MRQGIEEVSCGTSLTCFFIFDLWVLALFGVLVKAPGLGGFGGEVYRGPLLRRHYGPSKLRATNHA